MRKISALLSSVCFLAACGSNNDGVSTPSAAATAAPTSTAETPQAPENTYVGDVNVGDLSLKQVWIPDVGQSGYEFKVWFDLSTKKAKQKVYVTLDFVHLATGNASDLNPNSPDFGSEYPKIPVGGFVVDKIDPSTPIHVEQAFTLPGNLPDGKYAAVFGINQIDVFPEVNAAQGETAAEDPKRVMIAPATVIVGKPNKPNLRVLTSSLTENYFTRPVVDPANPDPVPARHIQVNLEVDSMAVDTTKDVDVDFKLSIGGQTYPLKVGAPSQNADPSQPGTSLALLDRWTYKAGDVKIPALPDDVTPDEVPLHSTTEPIAVATQMPIGRTFDLYLPDDAWDALSPDAKGEVIATIDPDNKIDEWGSSASEQKGDNVKRHPIQFLVAPPAPEATSSKGACHTFYNSSQQYGYVVKDLKSSADYGNDKFKIGYGLRGIMSGGDTSVKFGTYNYVAGKIFGFDIRILDANAELDSDIDCGSYYGYQIDVLGIRAYGDGAQFDAGEAKTLWEGDYKLSKTFEHSTTFMVGGIVPIDVTGGLTGVIGVVPKISVGPLLRLNAEVAPYASLTGMAEGGVNLVVVRGGIGIELLLIKLTATNTLWVELPFKTAKYQNNPPYTALTINYKLPLEIKSLDGRFYLWADRRNWWWKWVRIGEQDIVNWDGYSWTYDLVPLQTKAFSLVKK